MLNVTGWVKMWTKELSDSGKYYTVSLASSHKTDEGGYATDYSHNFARFVGHAKNKLDNMAGDERINITNATIEHWWNKDTNKSVDRLTVFDFETSGSGNGNNNRNNSRKLNNNNGGYGNVEDFTKIPDDVKDEEMPFD